MPQVKILVTFEIDGPPVPSELLNAVEEGIDWQIREGGLTAADNQETEVLATYCEVIE